MPPTKLSILTAHMRAGEWRQALSLAAKFGDLGAHKEPITRGHNAAVNPGFYTQINKDPAALVDVGIAALKARYPFWEETAK